VDITLPNINALTSGVQTLFNQYLAAAPGYWDRVSLDIGSTGAEESYPRLDLLPGFREWVGDRQALNLSLTSYRLANRTYEKTLSIAREDVEDDKFGLFNLAVQQLGTEAGQLPDRLIWDAARVADAVIGPDGQYYFDVDHQNYDATGASTSASNFQAGSSPAWYLMDLSKPLKPFILQRRRAMAITPMVALDTANVFFQKSFVWGADGRLAAGYGLWQLAFKSKAALTYDNIKAAYTAMTTLRRPDGQPLAITPTHLVFGPTLKADANLIAKAQLVPNAAGTATQSNPWLNAFELLEVPYIT